MRPASTMTHASRGRASTYRTPSRTCPRPRASRGPGCISERRSDRNSAQTASATIALVAYAQPCPTALMSRPAAAGPIIPPIWLRALFVLMAERSMPSPTTSPTRTCRAGCSTAATSPSNSYREVNIVTIEDPIEVLHHDKKAIISQREVRQDTVDFNSALRAAMRQDPDVILVGEMRDLETVRAALAAAETGHLVLSTLHTIDAQETINRIVDFFPPYEQKQVRTSVSQSLRGIISQRLLRRQDATGRCVAVEVMVNTGRTAEVILDPTSGPPIVDLIADGGYYKMQTFDQHLFQLIRDGVVSYDEALSIASNLQDLTVELRGAGVIA